MKVYINKRGSASTTPKIINNSILNEIYLKQKKNKEILMEEKITKLVTDIKQKISEGKDIQKITLEEVKDIDSIIEFILNKNSRKANDIIIIRQFLISFSSLSEILSLNDKFNDTSDLIYKISSSLKKEEIPKNEILFLNGQLGKTFYLILQGEVSVLIPMEYSVTITCSQFYEYMEFLLDNKEYELIRLSYKSNERILKERNIQNLKQYEKFLALLETNLPSNAKYDPTEIGAYMDKFTNFVNKILEFNDKLEKEKEKKRKEKEAKDKENEEKEEEEEEKEEKEDEKKSDTSNLNISKNEDNDDNDDNDNDNDNDNEKKKRKKIKEGIFDENKFNYIKYKFFLWKYYIVCDLGKGKSFGEVALKKGDNRRTATIMTKTDCIFGILEKDEYQSLIKEFIEKARKINTESLMKSKLFHGYREDLFDTHYFNCFKANKKYKGDFLFKQNEKREFIYFIKKGDVQIELFSSWKDLDKTLVALGNTNFSDKKIYNDLINSNEKLDIFSKKKQKFIISIYSTGEIVGLEEHIYPDNNTFMFSAVCLSECEIFSLELEFLEKMISERILRHNYNKLNSEKKEKLIQRLLILKSNILYQYKNLIEDKIMININENENKNIENNENDILKSRNIFKTRKKLVFFSPGIKTEISSYSLERKHLKKDLIKTNQNKATDNPLLSSSNFKKTDPLILPYKNKTIKMHTFYGNEIHSERESKSRLSNYNNNFYKLNTCISNINMNKKNQTLKIFDIKKNNELSKTERNKTLPKRTTIKYFNKNKVPKLLYENAKTVNKIIDKLISKEKILYSENRKNINDNKSSNESNNIKNQRKFISHLELLGFDKLCNEIAINTKKEYIENKTENSKNFKNIDKIKLEPILKTKNQKKNFNFNKYNNFNY